MPSACVLTKYGPPSVLEWAEVAMPEPSKGEIRIKAIVSGVGPTDLKIRRGSLAAVYPLPDRAVLGFETAGVVDAVGDGVKGVAAGAQGVERGDALAPRRRGIGRNDRRTARAPTGAARDRSSRRARRRAGA